MRLQNKVAIITGGGRGLGRAYALRLAQEGASLMLPDIGLPEAEATAKEIRGSGGKAMAMLVDVRNEEQVNIMAQKTTEEFGGIDILINNAAFYGGLGFRHWDAWTVEEWKRYWDINVIGSWLCAKAVVPYMRERGKGKIINISSASVQGGFQAILPYTCTKAGIISLTRGMARSLGRYLINVNCIAPGYTMTAASLDMAGRSAEGDKAIVSLRAIRRDEQPEDLVGTVLLLASDDSDFITGQTIVVDGGDCMP